MRFGSIITVAALASSSLVSAAPLAKKETKRDDVDAILNSIREVEHSNGKRDLSSIVEQISGSSLEDLLEKYTGSSQFSADQITNAIAAQNFTAASLVSAIKNSDLGSKFYNYVLDDPELLPTALNYAKTLFSDPSSKRDEVEEVEELGISKREIPEYISSVYNALESSGLLSTLSKTVMENDQLKEAATSLVSSAAKNIDFSSLFNSVKQSGLAGDVLSSILSSKSQRDLFEQEIRKRDLIDNLLDSALGNSPASSAAPTTPQGAAPVSKAAGGVSSAPPPATSTVPAPAASAASSLASQIYPAASSVASSVASAVSSATTSGSGLDGILGDIFGTPSTTTAPTTTVPTTTSTSTTEGILEELFNDFFGSGPTTTTGTVATLTTNPSSPSSTSTTDLGSFLSDVLGDIFGGSSNSSTPSTTGGGSGHPSLIGTIISDVIEIVGKILSSIWQQYQNHDLSFTAIIEDVINAIFGGSSSSGSPQSKAVSNGSGGGFIDFFENIINDLFGSGTNNSTSSIGSSIGRIIGEIFESIFHAIFGGSSSTSSISGPTGTAAPGTGLPAATGAPAGTGNGAPAGTTTGTPTGDEECCCSGGVANSKREEGKIVERQAKKAIRRELTRRAQKLSPDEYLYLMRK